MTELLVDLAAVLAWGLVGMAGFVWWWTSKWDFTTEDLDMLLYAAAAPPRICPLL